MEDKSSDEAGDGYKELAAAQIQAIQKQQMPAALRGASGAS